jgi:peptide/nickel transport system substrate-binding protein
MDPYAMNETFTTAFLAHINEPLVRRLPDLGLEPGLAERWERLTDTLWRFHLRRNVTFHEGEPFTAADVVFSLERVRKPGSAMLARVASIRAASAIDPHTVEIETDGPAPTLLADLTNILILSRRWAEAPRGVAVFLADPGRAYLQREGLAPVARFQAPTTRELENRDEREVAVLQTGWGPPLFATRLPGPW